MCQPCSSFPRLPSGCSRLCSGPATKPSSEIDIWHVVSCTNTLLGGCERPASGPPILRPSDGQPQAPSWRTAAGLPSGRPVGHDGRRVTEQGLNRKELDRYVRRVTDRWTVQRALLAGARVDDANGAPPQRERGPEYVVVLVSEHFDGIPWLERVYQAGSLWDALEMGARAELHCYTPAEFERKVDQLPVVRAAVERGHELLPQTA